MVIFAGLGDRLFIVSCYNTIKFKWVSESWLLSLVERFGNVAFHNDDSFNTLYVMMQISELYLKTMGKQRMNICSSEIFMHQVQYIITADALNSILSRLQRKWTKPNHLSETIVNMHREWSSLTKILHLMKGNY